MLFHFFRCFLLVQIPLAKRERERVTEIRFRDDLVVLKELLIEKNTWRLGSGVLLHMIMKRCLEIICFSSFPESDSNKSMSNTTTCIASKKYTQNNYSKFTSRNIYMVSKYLSFLQHGEQNIYKTKQIFLSD